MSIENNQLLQKGGVKKVNYILYSQGGGVVAKGLIVNGQLRINNLPYPSGIYILQIVEEPGVYETFKIILWIKDYGIFGSNYLVDITFFSYRFAI